MVSSVIYSLAFAGVFKHMPVAFPPHVWNLIKAFAIESCPCCNGECVLPGNMPCWLDELSQLLHDPEYSPRQQDRCSFSEFRRYWFDLHRMPSRGSIHQAPAFRIAPRENLADADA